MKNAKEFIVLKIAPDQKEKRKNSNIFPSRSQITLLCRTSLLYSLDTFKSAENMNKTAENRIQIIKNEIKIIV